MAKAFKVGDVIENADSSVRYEILGTDSVKHGRPAYLVKVLRSRNPRRVGAIDQKPVNMIDNDYVLLSSLPNANVNIPLGTVAHMSKLDVDAEIENIREQFKKATTIECECGAHKCGYSNEEVHGHSRWCPVVTRAFRVPIFDKEA